MFYKLGASIISNYHMEEMLLLIGKHPDFHLPRSKRHSKYEWIFCPAYQVLCEERSGLVVECLARDREVAG